MKVKPLLESVDTRNFIHQYLTACGIKDVDAYLEADLSVCDDPWEYPNMKMAVERLHQAINSNEDIGVLVDCDLDGQLSSAMIVNFLHLQGKVPVVFHHIGKAHGLRKNPDEDMIQQVLESMVKLLIIPDASSNDTKECKELTEREIDVLICDHHEITTPNPYAILVNHHLGNGLNTALSGTGVVFKLINAYCKQYKIVMPDYTDMVAVSLVSDVCDMTSIENRAFVAQGLSKPNNKLLAYMAEKLNRKGNNPEGYSWGLIPPGNALTRSHNQDDKEAYFNALVGFGDIEEGLKVARKVHREQTAMVKSMVEELEPTLDMSHKAIIGFTDANNKEYIGLVANKYCGKYNKPCILLREASSIMWSGSIRSPFPLASLINSSGLANCQGHEEAAGILIKKSNLKRFMTWIDKLDIDTTPDIPVTASIKPKQITLPLCHAVVDNMMLWAKGVDMPVFHVHGRVNKGDIQVFQKNTTTVKIMIDDIAFLLFMAKEDDVERLMEHDVFDIDMVVRLDVNEWNGVESPQAKIEEWEISKIKDNGANEENWMDLF